MDIVHWLEIYRNYQIELVLLNVSYGFVIDVYIGIPERKNMEIMYVIKFLHVRFYVLIST